MARAKKIIRKSEREALKERRRSGEFKQDKKDARAAGLSRGDARKRAKRLSRVQALSKRKGMRADMAAKRNEDASVNKMFADRRRMEARRGGQELAYAIDKPLSPAEQREMAPGGVPPKKIKSGDKVSKEKGMYKIVGADGYVRYSQSEPEIIKRRKNKAMYGAKVKAVKKAPGGAAMKKMPTYKKGGVLKSVPSDNKGLSKLPTSVRNNMGYMEDGGRLKRLKKKAHKKLTKGYNLTEKVQDSKRGENLLTGKAVKPMSEKKMDRLRKRADKKNRKGFAALKKMKDGNEASKGAKVVIRGKEQRPAKPFRTMKEIEDRRNEEKKAKRLIKK